MREKYKFEIFVYLILFCGIFLIYGRSLNYPFIWDDLISISQNPNFGNEIYIKELINGHFFDAGVPFKMNPKMGFYRPIVGISYVLNSKLGKTPFSFRIVNLFIHFFNALMLYVLIKRFGVNKIYSFLISLLFAVHPVATGSVVYISGRTDLLKTFFGLLSILSYMDRKYLSTFIFVIFSILSKEDGIMFPFVFVLLDLYRKDISKKSFIFPIISFLYLLFRKYVLHFITADINTNISYLGTVFKSFFIYLRIYLFPYDIHFEKFYPLLKSNAESLFWIFVFVIFYGFLFVFSAQKRKPVFFLLIATFLFIPVANFFPIYPEYAKRYIFLADHFLYLPGVFIILYIISFISEKYKRVAILVMMIYIAVFSLISYSEIKNWKDPETFYNVIIKKSHFPLRAYNNLAAIYARDGDDRCLYYLDKMKKIMNKNYIYYYILQANWYYFRKHNIKKAIEVFEDALRNNVRAPLILVSLGDLYYEYGDYEKSAFYYEKWIKILKLNNPNLFYKLAKIYKKAGNEKKYNYYLNKYKNLQKCNHFVK